MDYARAMHKGFLIGCCIFSAMALAEDAYRSVDEQGNMVFSDKQTPGAEKIELQEAQTIEPLSVEAFEYTPPKQPTRLYESIEISSPQDDAAIRANNGNVTISVSLRPDLQDGHVITISVDGEEVSSSTATSIDLTSLDRGTHNVRAFVQDAKGRLILDSKTTTFHVLRHSIQHP